MMSIDNFSDRLLYAGTVTTMQSVFLPEDISNLFVFLPLLLLLSGDIELNPGPRTGKIQQVYVILLYLTLQVTHLFQYCSFTMLISLMLLVKIYIK